MAEVSDDKSLPKETRKARQVEQAPGKSPRAQALSAAMAEEGMRTVSGGTDTHLALVDLQSLGVTGHDADGKAVFVSDEMVEPVTLALLPGSAFHLLWGAASTVTRRLKFRSSVRMARAIKGCRRVENSRSVC